jgi:hypothetical protein
MDPRSPANRGWGWGWGSGVPYPGLIPGLAREARFPTGGAASANRKRRALARRPPPPRPVCDWHWRRARPGDDPQLPASACAPRPYGRKGGPCSRPGARGRPSPRRRSLLRVARTNGAISAAAAWPCQRAVWHLRVRRDRDSAWPKLPLQWQATGDGLSVPGGSGRSPGFQARLGSLRVFLVDRRDSGRWQWEPARDFGRGASLRVYAAPNPTASRWASACAPRPCGRKGGFCFRARDRPGPRRRGLLRVSRTNDGRVSVPFASGTSESAVTGTQPASGTKLPLQ